MEISNSSELVEKYYKRIFFLFMPNICNARCSFCYVEPRFSKHAEISQSLLKKTDSFVKICKEVGFNEFRITGGEPLLFKNTSEFFSIFQSNGVSYTLLTNGINLENTFQDFENNKPKKITISYHSKKHYKNIFGVDYNTNLLDENIKEICRRNIPLTVTILLLAENVGEIYSHVLHVVSLGVKSIKFIYLNAENMKLDLVDKFNIIIEQLSSIKNIELRYSNTKSRTCNLVDRGFLSFPLSHDKIYGCCNSITDDRFISTFDSAVNLTTTLWDFYKSSRELKHFPCTSHVDFCPIALND